ncbi:MAG: hypothetical protein AAFQ80_14000 [Cyanobacteria bacterium J06621_8]
MTAMDNLKKYSVATLKGLVGLYVPFGSLAVELFNVTIPEQRLERVEKLVRLLASKEFNMASEELEEKFNSPEFIDIFEDVIHQTVRSLSDERLEYLASILEKSLTDKQIEHLQTKRLLSILEKINDVEVILLQYFQWNTSHYIGSQGQDIRKEEEYKIFIEKRQSFEDKHKQITDYLSSYVSLDATEEQENKFAMFKHYTDNLISLGLIGKNIDSFSSKLCITRIGGVLLNLINLGNDYYKSYSTPINSFEAIVIAKKDNNQTVKDVLENLEKAIDSNRY